jgi:N-acetylneuraminic acid mutarotase
MKKMIIVPLLIIIFTIPVLCQFSWTIKNCLPSQHIFPVTFSLGNSGYIVGGSNTENAYDANQVWEYNSLTNVMTQKNNFPRKIFAGSGFVINGIAYVGIGSDSGFDYKSDFWKYDAVNDIWIQIADFPGAARYAAMTFSIGNKGYLGCGYNGNEFNDFYVYDPALNTWTQLNNFPGPARQTGSGLSLGGFGYVGLGFIGGTTDRQDMYQYNPANDSWTQIADFPGTPREGCGAFVIADSFYIAAGGDYPYTDSYNDCWRYDPSTNTWAVQQNIDCVSPAFVNTTGFSINGQGYILSGYSQTQNASLGKALLEFGPPDHSFVQRVYVLVNDSSSCDTLRQTLNTHNSCSVWSTGVVDSEIVVTTPGTYWAQWPGDCGMVADTIVITGGKITLADSIQNAACGLNDGSAGAIPLSGDPPYIYSWSTGDTSSLISGLSPGNYSVTVDRSNCSSTLTAIVNSINIEAVTITSDTNVICSGSGTEICAPAGFNSYTWNTGQTGICIYAQQPGGYDVSVSNGINCSAVSNQVVLSELPAPSISVSKNGDTLSCYNGTKYQWYLDGSKLTGDTNAVLVAPTSGGYTVVVTDSNGCTAQSNAIAILGAGILNINEDDNIHIYPNPLSNGNVTLEVNETLLGSHAQIFDSKGSMVNGFNIDSIKTNMALKLESGVYIIRITSRKNVFFSKLVKL